MEDKMKAYDRMTETFEKLKTNRIKEIGKVEDKDFTRNRKMPFEDISRYILSKKGKTTTMEINNYFKEMDKREDRVTKQAFCKQRLKLNPKVFVELGKEYVESIYSSSSYKTYKGYILTAIDGTVLEIPNTEELREEFGYMNPAKENVRKTARAKGSGIYDVENNVMIDALIDKHNTCERTLAKKHIQNMTNILGKEKNIITIFDRGYISTEMIMFLMDYPVFYVFRVPGTAFTNEKKSMKSNDEIVDMKTNRNRQESIQDNNLKERARTLKKTPVRMIKVTLDTGEDEYLITNIPLEDMDTEEMGKLYFRRWGIETAYDVIKNKLYLENFSGRKKIIVEQEFHAQMLLFNMAEDLKNEANSEVNLNKSENLKYDYKVNLNVLIGTFRGYMVKIALEEDDIKRKTLYTFMMEEIMENVVPIRPERKNKRVPYKGRNKYKTNSRQNS